MHDDKKLCSRLVLFPSHLISSAGCSYLKDAVHRPQTLNCRVCARTWIMIADFDTKKKVSERLISSSVGEGKCFLNSWWSQYIRCSTSSVKRLWSHVRTWEDHNCLTRKRFEGVAFFALETKWRSTRKTGLHPQKCIQLMAKLMEFMLTRQLTVWMKVQLTDFSVLIHIVNTKFPDKTNVSIQHNNLYSVRDPVQMFFAPLPFVSTLRSLLTTHPFHPSMMSPL